MSKLEKETVLENFTAAFTKANGKAPEIEAKGGWYSVDGGKNVRLAQLEEMTAELTASAPAKKPAAKKPAAKKTEAKKEAPVKAEKPKKAAPKAKKAAKKKGGFSVKDFYTQQIQAVNPGAKAPR